MCLYLVGLVVAGSLGLLTGCGIASYRVTESWRINDRLEQKCRTYEVIMSDLRAEIAVLRKENGDGKDVSD